MSEDIKRILSIVQPDGTIPDDDPLDAPPDFDAEVVDVLEDLLERATAGEVVALAIAVETVEDIQLQTVGAWTWSDLISATAQLAFRAQVEAIRAEAAQED